jgi:hypothetical protein
MVCLAEDLPGIGDADQDGSTAGVGERAQLPADVLWSATA